MAWLKSESNLEKHPKLLAISRELDWERDRTIGFLHRFWHWVLSYAEDGDLNKFSNEIIAEGLNCELKVIEAFYKFKWIDEDRKVHNWLDYAGKYLESKYRTSNPKKWKTIVRKYRQSKNRLKTVFKPTDKTRLDKTDKIKIDKDTIKDIISYFNEVCKRNLTVNKTRIEIISKRLKEGISADSLKKAILNFSKDNWIDRHKYMDIVYAIGIRDKIDNYEKWIDYSDPQKEKQTKEEERRQKELEYSEKLAEERRKQC